MFEEAAKETSIEKNLLAAISFQESQWDRKLYLIWVLEA